MQEKKKRPVFKITYIAVFLVIILGVLMWYSSILKGNLTEEVRSNLKEISCQNALIIQNEIEGDLNILIEISERIGISDLGDEEGIAESLREITKKYPFKRLGFCNKDGMAYTTDGLIQDRSEEEYFKKGMKGEFTLSNPTVDMANEEEVIIFGVPVKKNEEAAGVLFATYSINGLKEILQVSFFEGEGYTYIVRADGSRVADSLNPTSFQNMTNIFTAMENADDRNAGAVESLKRMLGEGKDGYVIFYNKVAKYMYSTPLGINDWYLIDVVPESVVSKTSNYILLRTYMVCLLLAAVYAVIVVLIFNEDRKKRRQMKELLYVDPLTKGATYTKFTQEVEKRFYYGKAAYIVGDLNDFKLVNELFGYEEGDKVLRYIWKVIGENCREGEMAARMIADRYTMLFYYEKKEEIEERIQKIAEEIKNYSLGGTIEYILHPAFGIYYVEKKEEQIEYMLNCATLALNRIKKEKDSLYGIYSTDLKEKTLYKKQLSDQMEYAYKNNEFEAFYQPKYDTNSKKLAGAEALIRWRKPDGTMISPGEFIPLAEESGFVKKLDKYIFQEVCLAQKRWIEKGKKVVPISVNLSRRHLENIEFIEEYKEILEETGVPIECIQLEITESALFEKQDELIRIIEKLHRLGFIILMDDFGTGYSSLMMLKQIPIDIMKLDKTFTDDYNDKKGEQIIRCVMDMAHNLSISITAEGVETEEQYLFFKKIGCDIIQGYYFARPMPEKDYELCMDNVEEISCLCGQQP